MAEWNLVPLTAGELDYENMFLTMKIWSWLWEYGLDYESMVLTMKVWSWLWKYGLDYESIVLTMRVWSWLWEYGLDYESMVLTMRVWSLLWENGLDYESIKTFQLCIISFLKGRRWNTSLCCVPPVQPIRYQPELVGVRTMSSWLLDGLNPNRSPFRRMYYRRALS